MARCHADSDAEGDADAGEPAAAIAPGFRLVLAGVAYEAHGFAAVRVGATCQDGSCPEHLEAVARSNVRVGSPGDWDGSVTLSSLPEAAGSFDCELDLAFYGEGRDRWVGPCRATLPSAPTPESVLSGSFLGEVRSTGTQERRCVRGGQFGLPLLGPCKAGGYIPKLDNETACPQCPPVGELLECTSQTPTCRYLGPSWHASCDCRPAEAQAGVQPRIQCDL